MKNAAVLRICADLCFFFSILCTFESLRPWYLAMAVFAAAALALGFVIVRCKSPALRALLALPSFGCLLLGGLSPLLFFPALGWLYYAIVMTRGAFTLPLDEYRRSYRVQLVIALFFVAVRVANLTIYRSAQLPTENLLFIFAFLFLGVFAMRIMQMGATMKGLWQLSNALSVILFPLLAVGVSLVLFLLLRFFSPALFYLFYPLGRLLIWLFRKLFPPAGAAQMTQPLLEFITPPTAVIYEPEDSSGTATTSSLSERFLNPLLIERATAIGAYVILALLLFAAVWLVVRYSMRGSRGAGEEELYYDETERGATGKKSRRASRRRPVGHARQLRRIYQVYLETMAARGVSIDKSDTSQDVLSRANVRSESTEAARLRELYIAARYGDPKAVTAEQVAEAQHCLDVILGEQ